MLWKVEQLSQVDKHFGERVEAENAEANGE